MNSFIRAASKMAMRPITERVLFSKPICFNNAALTRRWAHNQPLTYDFVRERILLMLRLFDKVDPGKLTLDSHFVHDLGLDSLDHVEIIMHLEDEFLFEIPDKDAEKLITPGHILRYITDKEECYKELQDLQASSHGHHELPLKNYSDKPLDHEWVEGGKYWKGESKLPAGYGSSGVDNHKGSLFKGPDEDDHHHHDHDHEHDSSHGTSHHGVSVGNHHDHNPGHQQKRGFCTTSRLLKEDDDDILGPNSIFHKPKVFPTSFNEVPPKEIKIEDIQARVMKVCSNYDKIDSSKLDLASHLVQDLGLDSLDHVEIMMELEDEFGLEIPDKDAEKLMRPAEMARYIFQKEEGRALNVTERPF